MGWRVLLVTLAACGGMVVRESDGSSQAPVGTATIAASPESRDSSIDFVCPPVPLTEGSMCVMPSYEQCKYYQRGQWLCFTCDKTGHWTSVGC